jgi:hypothetical protein
LVAAVRHEELARVCMAASPAHRAIAISSTIIKMLENGGRGSYCMGCWDHVNDAMEAMKVIVVMAAQVKAGLHTGGCLIGVVAYA